MTFVIALVSCAVGFLSVLDASLYHGNVESNRGVVPDGMFIVQYLNTVKMSFISPEKKIQNRK